MLTVVEPMFVQFAPFADRKPVTVLPIRCTRTQYGADGPESVVSLQLPPVFARHWNEMPCADVTATSACRELAASVSRIITPPFAHGYVFSRELTYARISQSPLTWR
jgi:hypothetical protein